jgi:hypothetical protein
MKVLFVFVFIFMTSGLIADPGNVIPSSSDSDFTKEGLFGKSPKYNEETIMLYNYINYKFGLLDEEINNPVLFPTSHEMDEYDVDLFAYGQGVVSSQQAFDIIGETLKSSDVSSLEASNWGGTPPETVYEAVDRMAALLKTLNGGTPIP